MISENRVNLAKWRVRMLGALEVESPDGKVTPLRRAKAGALLGRLALRLDQPCEREALAEQLWPESDPTSRRTRLRQELANLRALFRANGTEDDGPLRIGSATIALRSAYVETDAGRFLKDLYEAAAATSDPMRQEALLEQALTTYRGDMLQEYPAIDVPERAWYSQRYEAALRAIAGLLKARRAYAEAEGRMHQLIRYEPLLEEAHTDLMRLYVETGRPDQAQKQYAQLEHSLRTKLTTSPTAATRKLVTDLLEARPSQEGVLAVEPVLSPKASEQIAARMPASEAPHRPNRLVRVAAMAVLLLLVLFTVAGRATVPGELQHRRAIGDTASSASGETGPNALSDRFRVTGDNGKTSQTMPAASQTKSHAAPAKALENSALPEKIGTVFVRRSPTLFLVSDLRSGSKGSIVTIHGVFHGSVWNYPVIHVNGEDHGIDLKKYRVIKVDYESEFPAQTKSIFKQIKTSMHKNDVWMDLLANSVPPGPNDAGPGGITKVHLLYTFQRIR